MKKIILVCIIAILAIGLSSFSNVAGNSLTNTSKNGDAEFSAVIKLWLGKLDYTLNGDRMLLKVAPTSSTPPLPKDLVGNTYMTITEVAAALNVKVDWDGKEKKVMLTQPLPAGGTRRIDLWISKKQATIDGKEVWIDSNRKLYPAIVTNKTMLPLRFVGEALGAKVDYETATKKITITYLPLSSESKEFTIKGSDTLVNLCADWAEAYMKDFTNVNITVNGGGSGVGIAALINGTTDIASASREMKEKEKDSAKKNGREPVETKVALDGISIILNPKNSVSQLTMEQLMKMYTGEYTNWKQVGGDDMPIILLSRENSSGTYAFFLEHVLLNKNFAASAHLLPSNGAIVNGVVADKGAIGYVGLAYAEEAGSSVKITGIKKDSNSPPILPSILTVKNNTYPISRALYLYSTTNSPAHITSFIKWCLSDEGQDIVNDVGYIKIK